jgi:hypothetical protein
MLILLLFLFLMLLLLLPHLPEQWRHLEPSIKTK